MADVEYQAPPFNLEELQKHAEPILDSDCGCDLIFSAIAFADWILETCAPECKVRTGELVKDGL